MTAGFETPEQLKESIDRILAEPTYGEAMDAIAQVKVLREAFKFIDDSDWDYLDRVLVNNVRHQQDSQNGIWVDVMRKVRAALALSSSNCGGTQP